MPDWAVNSLTGDPQPPQAVIRVWAGPCPKGADVQTLNKSNIHSVIGWSSVGVQLEFSWSSVGVQLTINIRFDYLDQGLRPVFMLVIRAYPVGVRRYPYTPCRAA